MRMMQEQDAAARAARARMDEYAKRTPGAPAPLPDATAGETLATPPPPAPATPAVTGDRNYGNEGRSVPAPKTDYAGPAAFYDDYAKQQESNLAALRASPDYQARTDQATLKKGAAGYVDALALPVTVGRNVAVAAGKGINRAIGAVTGKAGPAEKSEYSSLTPMSDYVAPSDEAALTKGISEAKGAAAKLRELQAADAAAETSKPAGRMSLADALYRQESSSGAADTSKPNYAGAIGPMQIKPDTWAQYQRQGVIHKDWNIADPKQNLAGGRALADYYEQKYGDPARAAAAYYGGEGAVEADGTIHREWRDKKNPNAPTVGQYVDQVMARMNGGAPATQTAYAPAGASQYPPPPAFQATSIGPTMSAPNTNQSMANYAETTKLLQMRVQNAYDPREKDAAILQLHAHNLSGQDMQIQNLQRVAANNPAALNQLVGLFGGQNGAQYAVARDNKGNVQLVNADGSPVQGQLGLPMPAATLAANLGGSMRQDIQAQNAQVAAIYSQTFTKEKATADAKNPGEQELQRLKNQGNIATTQIHGENQLNVALLRAIEQSQQQGAPVPIEGGGLALWNHDNTVSLYSPPTKNPTTGLPMYTPPQIIQQGHPLLAGMGQITAKVND